MLMKLGVGLSLLLAAFYALAYQLARRRLPIELSLWPDPPPVSVLKPVRGLDAEAEANFLSFFTQVYPGRWELIFGVESPDDPAVPLLRSLIRQHPGVEARIVFAGPSLDATGKMANVAAAYAEARYDIIVVSDSDMRVAPDFLHRLVSPLQDPRVGLVGALPIYVKPATWWARALCFYAHLFSLCFGAALSNVQVPGKFAAGNQALRRSLIERIGGFESLAGYLSEDVRLAVLVRRLGLHIVYSATALTPVGQVSGAELVHVLARYQLGSRTLSLPLFVFTCLLTEGHWLGPFLCLAGALASGWITPTGRGLLLVSLVAVLTRAWVAWRIHLRWAGATSYARTLATGLVLDFAFLAATVRVVLGYPLRWRGLAYRVLRDGRVRRLAT